MGYYVHLHVSFACDTNDQVAEMAKKHLNESGALFTSIEAKWFLEELSERSGSNPGPKGGLSLWGIIGNHTDLDAFIGDVSPFFREVLFSDLEGGPNDFEHVLVFYEPEGSEAMTVAEIYLDEENDEAVDRLVVKRHERMPFKANQF